MGVICLDRVPTDAGVVDLFEMGLDLPGRQSPLAFCLSIAAMKPSSGGRALGPSEARTCRNDPAAPRCQPGRDRSLPSCENDRFSDSPSSTHPEVRGRETRPSPPRDPSRGQGGAGRSTPYPGSSDPPPPLGLRHQLLSNLTKIGQALAPRRRQPVAVYSPISVAMEVIPPGAARQMHSSDHGQPTEFLTDWPNHQSKGFAACDGLAACVI